MKHKPGLNLFHNDEADTTNSEETNDKIECTKDEIVDAQENSTEETLQDSVSNSDFEKLKSDYDALNSQYMRLAADFENFRKRQEAERENLLRFGTENALKKMIEVLDNFERAQKAMENVEDTSKYKESFDLLHKQVTEALSKIGLEPINAEGQEFDPNFHDAVMQTPTNEHKENTVIAELQKGYKYADKVLRPSLVNVATAE